MSQSTSNPCFACTHQHDPASSGQCHEASCLPGCVACNPIAKGDFVLLPRGRKAYRVTSINEDGTLTMRRPGRQPSATRRSYRGFGNDGTEWAFSIDPAKVKRVGS